MLTVNPSANSIIERSHVIWVYSPLLVMRIIDLRVVLI